MTPSAERARHRAVSGLLIAAFAVASLSQARVQVFDRKNVLKEAAEHAHFDLEHTEPAKRGTITSADGKTLAQSEDQYELGLNYGKVPASPAFFVDLASACGVPATELATRPGNSKGRLWRQPLSFAQAEAVRNVRRRWSADGVSLARSTQRDYPLAEATAGVVGCVRDGAPIAGLERSLNESLSGTDGVYRGYVDRTGSFVVDKDHPFKKRVNGANVVLTIDSGLQASALQSVRNAVQTHKAKSGCVVVIEPKTGDLLAVANWPTFDPVASWKPGDDFNMASMGAYEPGSTFKILTLAKALDDGVVGEHDEFQCPGQMSFGPATIHCDSHGGHRGHGTVDLTRAIAKSCNMAAAHWALLVGRDPMLAFMDNLGLFEKTDLGLPSQRSGQIDRKDPAKRLQLATMGFGQSMNVVPINLAAAYAMLANDGVMMKPRLVKSLDGVETPVAQRGQMVKQGTANHVMDLMESVIQSNFGTGRALKISGYRLAGKTGTAQKVGTAKGMYVSNFVGMVPARNPKAVVLVMVDSPSDGQYYGGEVAGPVFVDVAKGVIRRFGIPPTEHRVR